MLCFGDADVRPGDIAPILSWAPWRCIVRSTKHSYGCEGQRLTHSVLGNWIISRLSNLFSFDPSLETCVVTSCHMCCHCVGLNPSNPEIPGGLVTTSQCKYMD